MRSLKLLKLRGDDKRLQLAGLCRHGAGIIHKTLPEFTIYIINFSPQNYSCFRIKIPDSLAVNIVGVLVDYINDKRIAALQSKAV